MSSKIRQNVEIKANSTVSATQAAALVGRTPRRLQQLAAEGKIPRPERGRYPLAGLVQGILMAAEAEVLQLRGAATNSRLQEARAAEIEVRTKQREKTMVAEAVEVVETIIDEYGGPLRSDLEAIPARMTKDFLLRRHLEDAIENAFAAAGERASAAADREMAGPAKRRKS